MTAREQYGEHMETCEICKDPNPDTSLCEQGFALLQAAIRENKNG